ncbi:arylsulfatase [Achromobacter sp. AGC39]
MRISFLHTIDGNRAVFEHAAAQAGVNAAQLRHDVRPDFRQAIDQGPTTDDALHDRINDAVQSLAIDADAVIVTCATLGPVIDQMAQFPVPVIRADVALAMAATHAGGCIVVLCAAPSAVDANRMLFEHHAKASGATVAVHLVPDAWALFQAGDMPACLQACANAAQEAYDRGADVVAFAHPWMADAGAMVQGQRRPLDAARAGLQAALQLPIRSSNIVHG